LCPENDIDKVTFPVKPGYWYDVYTSDLALGVDTVMTVTVGTQPPYYDDDSGEGLASKVTCSTTIAATAIVTVTDYAGRGGSDHWYSITVNKGLDIYEPDDETPRPIGIGESQEHNFYPDNDRDLVQFTVKEGQDYVIFTSVLTQGVDTNIKVMMDDTLIGENDDYAPDTPSLASAVCFTPTVDGTAVATITNLEQQYEPDKTYKVTVLHPRPRLDVDFSSLVFRTYYAGPPPVDQHLAIRNLGGGILDWTARVDTAPTEVEWLNIYPESGTAPSGMTVSIDHRNLLPGVWKGSITITGEAPCSPDCTQCTEVINVTLRLEEWPTFIATQDTTIVEDSSDHWGGREYFVVGLEGGEKHRALIKFDLSDIAGKTIEQANLVLSYESGSAKDMDITAYRVTSYWTEDGATWSNMHDKYDDSKSWQGSISKDLRPGSWITLLDLTDLVQQWVDDLPSNYGIMLIGDEATENYKYFASREARIGYRPCLVVHAQD